MMSYLRHLMDLERSGERAPILIGPYSAMCMIGVFQMTLRSPALDRGAAAQVRGWIEQLTPFFAGTFGEKIIELGNDPEYDRPGGSE
jgi:hypothetical protein